MKEKTRRRKLWFPILWLCAIGIVVVLLINRFGQYFAEEGLQKLINKEISSFYTVSYQQVKADVWNKELHLTDLSFTPKSLSIPDSLNRLYKFTIPEFKITLKSSLELLMNQLLIIDGISITNPQISVFNKEQPSELTVSSESLSLFELVTQYLKLFKVNQFDLEGGHFKYHSGQQTPNLILALQDIDFKLEQFLLDSTLQKRHFLNAESIELILKNETFQLGDQIHELSFDQLKLSTKDSLLAFTNVHFGPINADSSQLDDVYLHNDLYDISIPTLQLKGIDYNNTYLSQKLDINHITFDHPTIRFRESIFPDTAAQRSNDAIMRFMASFAPSLQVDSLSFNDGHIYIDTDQFAGLDLKLAIDALQIEDIEIDPSLPYFSRQNPPFQSIALRIHGFYEKLPDQLHQIYWGALDIDSRHNYFKGYDLELSPIHEQPHPSKTKLALQIPILEIDGIDYLDLLFGEPIQWEKITIQSPNCRFWRPQTPSPAKEKAPDPLAILRNTIRRSWTNSIGVQQIEIKEGTLEVMDLATTEKLNLNLTRVFLNESTSSWDDLVKSIGLSAGNLSISHPTVQVQAKQFSTDTHQSTLNKLNLTVAHPNVEANGRFEQIKVLHSSIDDFFKDTLWLDTAWLVKPQIQLRKLSVPPKDTASPARLVSLPYLNIQNGTFNIDIPNYPAIDLKQCHAQLKLDRPFVADQFSSSEANLVSPDQKWKLTVKELEKPWQKDNYLIAEAAFRLSDTAAQQSVQLHLEKVRLLGLNQQLLRQEQTINAKSFAVQKALARVVLGPSLPSSKQEDANRPLPQIRIDSIWLPHLNLGFQQINASDTLQLAMPKLSLLARNVHSAKYDGDITTLPKALKDLQVTIDEGISVEHSKWQFSADKLDGQHPKGNLSMSNWQVNMDQSLRPLKASGNTFDIQQFDLDHFLAANEIHAHAVLLDMVHVAIPKPNQEKSTPPTIFPIDSIVSLPIPRITLDTLALNRLDLAIPFNNKASLGHIQLKSSGLQLDTTINIYQIENYFDDLYLDIDQISLYLGKNDEYIYQQSMTYHAAQSAVYHRDIQLIPQFSRESFTTLLSHQVDYFNLKIDQITQQHFHWRQLLKQPHHLSKMKIEGLQAEIFRDKTLPHRDVPVPLIQGQLRDLPMIFTLDTLDFKGDILVSELPKASYVNGGISFTELNARVTNITNNPNHFNHNLRINASGKIYDQGNFQTVIDFDLQDDKMPYKMIGRVGEFDLTTFNQLLTPIARVNIQSGLCKDVMFNISGNDDFAIGEMVFQYNDLKFQIVNRSDIHHVNLGNSILSFWANRFVKSNNPASFYRRKGTVFFERNPNRAIFHLWAKSLLSGVIASVGVKNNKKKLKRMAGDDLNSLDFQELFDKPQRKHRRKKP